MGILGISRTAYADGPQGDRERDYEEALQIAQKKVLRENPAVSGSHLHSLMALLPGGANHDDSLFPQEVLIRLTGRSYHVGETWEVASVRIALPEDRGTAQPEMLKELVGKPSIFRYTVLDASTGPQGTIRVKVEPVDAPNYPSADQKIDHLELTLKANSDQTQKTYFFKGHHDGVNVSPEGIRSGITALEFYPLDLPEIRTADPQPGRMMPELPPALAQAVHAQGIFHADPGQSIWFEQDDFFGRPVQALWQKNEPWPTYLKTPYGISVLLRTGGAR